MNLDAAAVDDRHLSADLAMDAVTLRVGDLEMMSSYYENALALTPLEETSRRAGEVHRVLGRGQVPFVRLISTPGLPTVDPRQAGLFHTAFLFEDQASLAGTVLRTAQDPRSRFAGTGDHLVSEAFYFTDPEGNGIELYVDRPRDSWQWKDGQVVMDTLYIDPQAYLDQHLSPSRPPPAPGRCRAWWATCTCRWATWRAPAASTSTPWASRPPWAPTPERCSPPPAATTTTSP